MNEGARGDRVLVLGSVLECVGLCHGVATVGLVCVCAWLCFSLVMEFESSHPVLFLRLVLGCELLRLLLCWLHVGVV